MSKLLGEFPTHSLRDVGELSLKSRFDTKYLLPFSQLSAFLQALRSEYSVLAVERAVVHRYHTTYFDTPSFSRYLAHHNEHRPRSKIRCRTYLENGRSFVELKRKDNRGRTDKVRIRVTGKPGDSDVAALLTQAPFRLDVEAGAIRSCVAVDYQRISLWNRQRGKRISIDCDFRASAASQNFSLAGLAIVEIKQLAIDRRSPASVALRESGCRPSSFSKYCIACALLYRQQLKSNRFRPLLQKLQPYLNTSTPQVKLHAGI